MTNPQTMLPLINTIVVGGQWGSEGKGAVIYEMAKDYSTHVRVGGPQAGHSIKLPDGKVLKLQCIPVGAAVGAECIIGMGSVVDLEVLAREIGWFQELGIDLNLTIDARATVLDPAHREMEGWKGLTARLGSTGKGVGAARAARIMRQARTMASLTVDELGAIWPAEISATTDMLIRERMFGGGTNVLVEAAQGIMLSLFSSGYYPFVTSSEATPTGAFADLGLPLHYAQFFESVGVFRTYPIRVAGNSGPLPRETTWETIEGRRGAPIDEEEKTTTVTRKLRRVADWDPDLAREAVVRQGLAWAALTFVDYVYPEISGQTVWGRMPRGVKQYVANREKDLGIPIKLVGTGFGTYAWRES